MSGGDEQRAPARACGWSSRRPLQLTCRTATPCCHPPTHHAQVSAAVSPDNEQTNSFRECVLIRHPRRDGEYAFAFITGQTVLQVRGARWRSGRACRCGRALLLSCWGLPCAAGRAPQAADLPRVCTAAAPRPQTAEGERTLYCCYVPTSEQAPRAFQHTCLGAGRRAGGAPAWAASPCPHLPGMTKCMGGTSRLPLLPSCTPAHRLPLPCTSPLRSPAWLQTMSTLETSSCWGMPISSATTCLVRAVVESWRRRLTTHTDWQTSHCIAHAGGGGWRCARTHDTLLCCVWSGRPPR